jgi:hypothetical protein
MTDFIYIYIYIYIVYAKSTVIYVNKGLGKGENKGADC